MLLLTLFVSLIATAFGAPREFFYVSSSSTCGQSCDGSVDNPYLTIQEGLDQVQNDNTTVVVMDGIYQGLGNTNIEIINGLRTISSQNGKDLTTIDCEGDSTFIELIQGTLFLNGFTIENCTGSVRDANDTTTYGGALYIENSYAVIIDSEFNLNSADFGGSIYVKKTTLSLESTGIFNGQANYYGGGIYAVSGTVIADDSEIINNVAEIGGGGLYINNGSLRFEGGSNLRFNTATNTNGNEILCERTQGSFFDNSYIVNQDPNPTNFEDRVDTVCENACELATLGSTDWCDVNQNITEYVYVDPDKPCDLACDGRENFPYLTIQEALDVADSLTVIILYDGLYTGIGNVNLSVFDSFGRIRALNSDSSNKAIVDCENEAFGFAFVKGTYELSGLTIRNCVGIQRNISNIELGNGTAQASNSQDTIGGAVWLELGNIQINNCTFENNIADIGAGFYSYFGTFLIRESTFDSNTANKIGGGIYVRNGYMVINNSNITNNNAGVAGGGLYIRTSTVEIDGGTRIWDNAAWNNGNEVYCASGAGKLVGDDASVGNADLSDFVIGDAVCNQSCTLTRAKDNFDLCGYIPPTLPPNENGDSSDETDIPETTTNDTRISAATTNKNASFITIMIGFILSCVYLV